MYYANSQIDFPAYAATVFGSPPPMHHTHTHTINSDFQFFPSVCNELISRWIYCQIKVIGLRRMRSSCSPPHSHCCLHSRARAQRICRSIVHARARAPSTNNCVCTVNMNSFRAASICPFAVWRSNDRFLVCQPCCAHSTRYQLSHSNYALRARACSNCTVGLGEGRRRKMLN